MKMLLSNTVRETNEGDRLLSHICKVLNSKVWPNEVNNVKEVMLKCSSPLSRLFTVNITKCLDFKIFSFSK